MPLRAATRLMRFFERSRDEEIDDVVAILERVVRAAADQDAGALVGELFDRVVGRQVHLLFDGALGRHMVHREGIGVHRDGIEKALRGVRQRNGTALRKVRSPLPPP